MGTASKSCTFILLLILAGVSLASAQLYRLESDNLKLIYTSMAQELLTAHTGRCFENSLRFHSDFFDYTSREKIVVFLTDFTDYGGAGASAVPRNGIQVNIAPFSYVYETRPANERINWVMNHELLHIVAGDKASGSDRFFRTIFLGKVEVVAEDPISMLYSYFTNPRWYSPRWYHEGAAVLMETWMAGGLGRALGPYDEMVFRTMVRDSAYIYDMVGLESEGTAKDFQVGAVSYLYGTRFVSYLVLQYGPDKFIQWISRTGGTKGYFATQFNKVYGISIGKEWSRWIEWEKEWQQANLQSLRKHPGTPYRPVSEKALGSVSRAYYNSESGKLYAAVLYPAQTAHIAAIDIGDGSVEKITDVGGPALYYVTSLAYDPGSNTLFYTTDNTAWRDLMAVDIQSRNTRTLIKDVRTGDLVFNRTDRSIWGVRHYNGQSTIVRIPYPYEEWDQVYSFPYGRDIFDIDLSPDCKHLSGALADHSGDQQLILMETDSLLAGSYSYEVLYDFELSSPANFVFGPEGRYLYGSSYYSGVSNIYRYDLEERDIDILSNCETGLFRPVPVSEDSLIALRYTGEGFVPVMVPNRRTEYVSAITYLGQAIVEKHPVVTTWEAGHPGDVDFDSLTVSTGNYSPIRSIRLASAYPIVQGYKDYVTYGLRFNFSDHLSLARLDLTASYSQYSQLDEKEWAHLGLDFTYWNWGLGATWNKADFYDLFGPARTGYKGYSASLRYKYNLLYAPPKTADFSAYIAAYGDLETLPDYQDVIASYDRYNALRLALGVRNMRATMGAVDYEKGYSAEVVGLSNHVNKVIIPRVYANISLGFLSPAEHTPVWLRASLGYSAGEEDEPFANFFFGGFGNNWVDHQEIKRYREYYTFPGIEINSVGGVNYAKIMLELVLPPLRFKSVGLTSAYLRWARLSLFSSALTTNMYSDLEGRTLLNVGGQLDLRLVTFSLLRSTFSVGYAVALEENRELSREFMISFKVL